MASQGGPVFSLAVIADAHFHDVEGDYGVPGIRSGDRRLTLRTWADTRESTRVFNESARAFDAALARVAEDGIRHVVLLGDYTDDGQRTTTESLVRRLDDHEARFGTRFYALPGNHDIFGPFGRHQSKHILQENDQPVLVTSDGRNPPAGSVVTPLMYCEGYPAGLLPMARHGYFPRPDYIHWETPFGNDGDPAARVYEAVSADGANRYPLTDASYLVEPEEGLWLLMLDANVFEPTDGTFRPRSKHAFIDSTAAGWNAMLRQKSFIIAWLADVSRRARVRGKTLLTFSHYPVIDPFDNRQDFERSLFPNGSIARRIPSEDVAKALEAAGIGLHFSGHWHVEGVSRRGNATNIAVPSLVAFPPAFKRLSVRPQSLSIETIDLSSLPSDPHIVSAYRRQATRDEEPADPAFDAVTYGAFLREHARALVVHRYFPREWPAEVVETIRPMTVADLVSDIRTRPSRANESDVAPPCDASVPMVVLVADWYCLRQGGARALAAFGDERIALLQWLAGLYTGPSDDTDQRPQAMFLRIFFKALAFQLQRAMSSGSVTAVSLA